MRLALGTVQFGQPYGIANSSGQISYEQAEVMLSEALAAGIDTLDTAVAYGQAETVLGKIGVSNFKLISKIPAIGNFQGDATAWVIEQVEASLSRLGIECLDGLMLHAPDDLLGPFGLEIARGMLWVKNQKLAKKIGLSVYTPEQLDKLINLMPLEIVQIPINVFDRRFEQSGWLSKLSADHVEIHARSIFLQGLLLMKPELIPEKFNQFRPLFQKWYSWLVNQHRMGSAVNACLSHVAGHDEISRIVVGVDSLHHLREIIVAVKEPALKAPEELASSNTNVINPSKWSSL